LDVDSVPRDRLRPHDPGSLQRCAAAVGPMLALWPQGRGPAIPSWLGLEKALPRFLNPKSLTGHFAALPQKAVEKESWTMVDVAPLSYRRSGPASLLSESLRGSKKAAPPSSGAAFLLRIKADGFNLRTLAGRRRQARAARLRAEGVTSGLHRFERLMRQHGLKSRPRRGRLPPDLSGKPPPSLRTCSIVTSLRPLPRRWIADFAYMSSCFLQR
jgi:hypothetical protein